MAHTKIILTIIVTTAILNNVAEVHLNEILSSSPSSSSSLLSVAASAMTTTEKRDGDDEERERSGRLIKIVQDRKFFDRRIKRGRIPPPHIRSRADHFSQGPHRLPISYQSKRNPSANRRAQNGVPTGPQRPQAQVFHYNYDSAKSSRYSPVKVGAVQFPNGKENAISYRGHFAATQQHPNSLPTKISQQDQYVHKFKASPHFSGKAIIRPANLQQHEHYIPQQQLQHQSQYQGVQQYQLPQPQQLHAQQYSENYAEFQQQQEQAQIQSLPQPQHKYHYEQTKALQDAQAVNNNMISSSAAGPASAAASPQHGYSVYEEPESGSQQQSPSQTIYNPNHYQVPNTDPTYTREAQAYLKFMNSNEYFLPKFDPNYRKIDIEKDQEKYQQQQLKQQLQQQQLQYSKTLADGSSSSSSSYSSNNNMPMEISQSFYQSESVPNPNAVRGSYQAGNNLFVVNSDGNKAIKHIVPSTLPTQPTTSPAPTYAQVRYSSIKSRTPEPVRFEFTERDAVLGTYTNSPLGQQLRYNGQGGIAPTMSTPTSSATSTTVARNNYQNIKPINEADDDPEDGEDMQEASSDVFGRVPVHKPTGTSTEPSSEQKDTEDYCERICANVQDDDDEVVCGSDGYMYTSEAQMECYASCLHIDVTIQSKGLCNSN